MSEIPHGSDSAYSYHKCRCDVCVAAKRERDRLYYQRNAEVRKAYQREYRAEHRDEVREKDRQYRETNSEKLKAQSKAYYQANKEAAKAWQSAWKKANPDKVKEQRARYREKHREKRRADALARYYRLMADDPESVRKQRREWVQTENGVIANRAARHRRRGADLSPEARKWWKNLKVKTCWYCGGPGEEIDHIVPITRGGDGALVNVVPACRSCNARKGDMTGAEFVKGAA